MIQKYDKRNDILLDETKIMVSVALKTFNTKEYVSDAIESVLGQKTNFIFELVISDDASSDGTSEIVKEYALKFPNIIKSFIASENMGLQKNDAFITNQCKGKYIAICDDDDYWTDSYKLQKQVDFLENNNEYVLVSHAVSVLNLETGQRELNKTVNQDAWDVTQKDFLLSMPVTNIAVLYKNNLIKEYPENFYTGIAEDRKKYILLTAFGKARFINDVVAFNRRRETSITGSYRDKKISSKIKNIEYEINLVEEWNIYLEKKYDEAAYPYIQSRKQRLLVLYLTTKQYKKAMKLINEVDFTLVQGFKRKISFKFILLSDKVQKIFYAK